LFAVIEAQKKSDLSPLIPKEKSSYLYHEAAAF